MRLGELISGFSRVDIVQRVWLVGRDRRWHSPEELAEQLPLDTGTVEAVLDFLVKYGFAESNGRTAKRVRINPFAPCPSELARFLRSIEGTMSVNRALYS